MPSGRGGGISDDDGPRIRELDGCDIDSIGRAAVANYNSVNSADYVTASVRVCVVSCACRNTGINV